MRKRAPRFRTFPTALPRYEPMPATEAFANTSGEDGRGEEVHTL
jgi:hypothetical protein